MRLCSSHIIYYKYYHVILYPYLSIFIYIYLYTLLTYNIISNHIVCIVSIIVYLFKHIVQQQPKMNKKKNIVCIKWLY